MTRPVHAQRLHRSCSWHGGFALLELMVALGLSLVIVASGATYVSRQTENIAADAAADHLRTVAKAADAYGAAERGQIETALQSAPAVSVTVEALQAGGYLPASVRPNNNYGQSYAIRFARTPAGTIEGVVVTRGGEAVKPRSKRRIASRVGLAGGHLDEQSMTSLIGANGSWARPLSDFGMGPGEADLAYALFVEDTVKVGGVGDQYMSRTNVAGMPELNRMEADLDMAGNDLNNVGTATVEKIDADEASVGALSVSGSATFEGRAEFKATGARGPLVNRTEAATNSHTEYKTTAGSVFVGQGLAGRFAVGGATNLTTNPWLEVSAAGAKVGGQDVWTTGTFDPAAKADKDHLHDGSHINTGTVAAARIANLDASKITSGTFSAARVPELHADKITTGVLAAARIPNLDASKVASGVLSADRIPALSIAKVSGLQAALDNKLNLSGGTMTGSVTFREQAVPLSFVSTSLRHAYMAWYVTSDGHRSGWFGYGYPGDLDIRLVNEHPIGNIQLNAARVLVNGGDVWTSTNFNPDSKANAIHNHDAANITSGTLAAARIPNLDASKITAGVLAAARIPQLAISKIDGLQAALNGKVSTTGNETIVGEKVFANHVRTTGPHGWYNHTYHGGWMMNDASWVRSIADKGVYSGGTVQSGTLLRSDGNLSVAARTTTNDLVLNSVAACNASCSPNGLQARTSTGAALSCVSGAWKGFSCGTPSGGGGTGPIGGCDCPPGYSSNGNGCSRNSYPYDMIQCP